MDGRPTGITYSRQLTTTQAGRPVGAPPTSTAPGPTARAVNTNVQNPGVGTTYLTINRGLLIGGLLFSLASPAGYGVAGYMFMGMFLAPTLLGLILTLSLNRSWSYLTATILGLVFPAMFLIMFAGHEGGFNPVNFEAFSVTILNICAVPLILVGGIGGFRNARGKTGVSFGPGFKTAPGVFALSVVSLLLGALVTSYAANTEVLATTNSGFDAQPQATTSVVMKDFAFEPRVLNIAANTYTQITVTNEDPSAHTLTYRNGGTEYNHEIIPGQTVSFVVLFTEAGTFNFWCIPHSGGADDQHEDSMVGQIVVA